VSQFIQNWQIITEVRSIYRRLGEFEHHLQDPQPHQEAEQQPDATGLRGKILSH
jgi:ABC-type long-subunit fatty acid transport system fused permease/ATPase subunit